MYGDDPSKFERMPGERLDAGSGEANTNPYAEEWGKAFMAEDMPPAADTELMIGTTPDGAPVSPPETPLSPEVAEDDPFSRSFEIDPAELAPDGGISDAAFEDWRARARQMFNESPDILHVILINAETGAVIADFQPKDIDTITRATATHDAQNTELLDNLSDSTLDAPGELSGDASMTDLLSDPAATDLSDSTRINNIIENSTSTTPLGATANIITSATATTASVVPGPESINPDDVVKKLSADGFSSQQIISAAEDLKDSVGPEDIDAASVTGFGVNQEEAKTIAANAAVVGMADAIEGATLEQSGDHEGALKAAKDAISAAEGAIDATNVIPALEGGDNDTVFGSADATTRQIRQMAEGTLASAEETARQAKEAIAAEEEAETLKNFMDTPSASEVTPEAHVEDEEVAVDPATGIPLFAPSTSNNLQLNAESANPQDDYFNLLAQKMAAEQQAATDAAAAQAEIDAYARAVTDPNLARVRDGDDPDTPHVANPIMS